MPWKPEYLVIEDCLSEEDFAKCQKIVSDNNDKFKADGVVADADTNDMWAKFNRWFPPPNSELNTVIKQAVFSDKIQKLKENFVEPFWKVFTKIGGFEVQVTRYKKGDEFKWHMDHITAGESIFGGSRILNYILYMNDYDDGGVLEISDYRGMYSSTREEYNTIVSIKPKRNMLVILPSWYVHRVTKLTSDKERLTINGHVYIKDL